jgi:hypothetical protein
MKLPRLIRDILLRQSLKVWLPADGDAWQAWVALHQKDLLELDRQDPLVPLALSEGQPGRHVLRLLALGCQTHPEGEPSALACLLEAASNGTLSPGRLPRVLPLLVPTLDRDDVTLLVHHLTGRLSMLLGARRGMGNREQWCGEVLLDVQALHDACGPGSTVVGDPALENLLHHASNMFSPAMTGLVLANANMGKVFDVVARYPVLAPARDLLQVTEARLKMGSVVPAAVNPGHAPRRL